MLDISKHSVVAEVLMGKSKNKPMSIAPLYTENRGDKKKLLNKSKASDRGKGLAMEIHSKASHDIPHPPSSKRKKGRQY